MYQGWFILAYNRNITKAEEEAIKNKLKRSFNYGDWYFSENSHRMTIFYGSQREEITVTFQKVEYGSAKDHDKQTYHIKFESSILGFRSSEERSNQELYRKTFEKIPWMKQGFWIQDNGEFPIPKRRSLRMRQ